MEAVISLGSLNYDNTLIITEGTVFPRSKSSNLLGGFSPYV